MNNNSRSALLFALLFFTGGQIYNGEFKKAVLFWLSLAASLGLAYFIPILGFVFCFVVFSYSLVDAIDSADSLVDGMSEGGKWARENHLKEEAKKQVGYVPDLSQRIPPEGGFKRKVKGEPDFKPFSPLPDEKSKKED